MISLLWLAEKQQGTIWSNFFMQKCQIFHGFSFKNEDSLSDNQMILIDCYLSITLNAGLVYVEYFHSVLHVLFLHVENVYIRDLNWIQANANSIGCTSVWPV